MASVEMECNGVSGNGIRHYEDALSSVGTYSPDDCKDLEDRVIGDLDSYLEDVDDCLTISRMVSDSLIKGMINAVSQEAAEVVSAKETEVARLNVALCRRLTISRMVSDSLIKGMVNAVSQEAAEVVAAKETEVARLKAALCRRQLGYGEFDVQFFMKHRKELVPGREPEVEISAEIEGQVFSTIIQGLCEEYDRRLFDVNNALAFIDGCKKISCVHYELDSIYKSLIGNEVGHPSPQVPLDVDNHHRKVLNYHGLHSGGLWDGNGECEEFKMSMPENFKTSKLTHLTDEELYQYFRTEMIKMKRAYESTVHKMTDENFALKRELLKEKELSKERGPFALLRKDKDFELFKNKILEVVTKLGDILKESEKLSEFCNHSRDTLDNLLSENHRLKDLLNSKKLAAKNLQQLVDVLKSSLEDAHLEAVINEKFYGCILGDVSAKMESYSEDLDMKSVIMQDIIGTVYEEAYESADIAVESNDDEVFNMESNLVQHIYGVVLQEALRDTSLELNYMKSKCLKNDESSVLLGSRASKLEKDLNMEIEENKKLNCRCLELENHIKVKDESLYKVTEKLNMLEDMRKHHEALMADRNKELVLLKENLEQSQNCVDLYMFEMKNLNEKLALHESSLRKSDEEKASLVSAIEQHQGYVALAEAKDREYRKQMKSICCVIDGLSKSIADFELKKNESIDWHCSRLENSVLQLCSFAPKINLLRRTSLLYKEILDKRCTDLQKAESEVDLLGDEVDALLTLLEKIYVALDHYSPVLQHYPGIIEILKLVKRELSGAALKAS